MTHVIKPTIETKNVAGTFNHTNTFAAVHRFISSKPDIVLNKTSLRSPLNTVRRV